MNDLKELRSSLIKLGSKRKDLRPHIRPVLAELKKTAGSGAQLEVYFDNHGTFKAKVGRGNLAKAERMSKRELVEKWIVPAYDGSKYMGDVEYFMQYPKAALDIMYADHQGG